MSVIGYGDNYGDRYGEAYTDETVQIAASGSFVLTGPLIVNESGKITATAEFNPFELGGYGSEYGFNYGEEGAGGYGSDYGADYGFAGEVIELGYADESGDITVTTSPDFDTTIRVLESVSSEQNLLLDIFDDGLARESLKTDVDQSLSIRVFSYVKESITANISSQIRFTPFVLTDSDDPVDAIRTILANIGGQGYAQSPPEVFAMWELDPQQRLSKSDPAVYVWSPTPGTLDRFSADGTLTTDSRTVEIMVMTYSEMSTHRYTESIIDILGGYMDDNRELTVYEDVEVDTVADERGDHLFGESNHYINTIEVSTSRLRRTDII